MSGVYIKGMEMPTSPVLFCIHPDGKVFADLEGVWREYQAVPVPPHGRTIDVDVLKPYMLNEHYKYRLVYDADEIANAPTVIPAEPPKEET